MSGRILKLLLLKMLFTSSLSAQDFIQHIDDSKIRYLKSEEVFILDLTQNYGEPTQAQLKRLAEIEEHEIYSETEMQAEVDRLSKELRYLDTFQYVMDQAFVIRRGENNVSGNYVLSRDGGLLLPRNIFIGKIGTYPYFYQVLTKLPGDVEVNAPEWMMNELMEKSEADSLRQLEVGVTITAKPEFNIRSKGKGYITIRVLELNAWYEGSIICKYSFNDREESTSVFSIKGVPITTHWKLINGKPEDITEAFYPNGKLYSKGQYFDASLTARHGYFEYYDQSGNLIRKENYYRGVPEGEAYDLYYGKNGLSSIIYKVYDYGQETCHEAINIINGVPRRIAVNGACEDEQVGELLRKLGVVDGE